ncbi:unnamed protein product [Danaus chrysippus]|uniref:(African queen) hypothetical protein n=1 Tax=Danaus chrysippus TaxID=151541 RepID=A0A8J2R152_9NEOP|nr:unnamed protein product [Danaus chrysippus]
MTNFIRQCRRSEELLRTEHKKNPVLPSVVQLSISETKHYYLGPEDILPGIKDEDSFIGEDDIPLVFLNEYDCEDDDVEGQSDVKSEKDDYKIAKRKKIKKDVKEGFSSRMVTETDEYVVIKLTKEQILEEMQQQSLTEKYKVLPYKCDKCVRGFNFEDVLRKHMEKHNSKNGPFQCELCTQYCPTKVSLRGHLKSHSTRYKCKLCGIVRLSRQHVLEHYSLEHTHTATVYKCPQCEHTTNKRTAMQRHVRLHSKCEPVKCDLCGKTYKSKESLRIHIMRHDEQKLHQCEICSSSFVYAAQLTKHIRSVHENKDYYCVECDIMFKSMRGSSPNQRSPLIGRIHTERPRARVAQFVQGSIAAWKLLDGIQGGAIVLNRRGSSVESVIGASRAPTSSVSTCAHTQASVLTCVSVAPPSHRQRDLERMWWRGIR